MDKQSSMFSFNFGKIIQQRWRRKANFREVLTCSHARDPPRKFEQRVFPACAEVRTTSWLASWKCFLCAVRAENMDPVSSQTVSISGSSLRRSVATRASSFKCCGRLTDVTVTPAVNYLQLVNTKQRFQPGQYMDRASAVSPPSETESWFHLRYWRWFLRRAAERQLSFDGRRRTNFISPLSYCSCGLCHSEEFIC